MLTVYLCFGWQGSTDNEEKANFAEGEAGDWQGEVGKEKTQTNVARAFRLPEQTVSPLVENRGTILAKQVWATLSQKGSGYAALLFQTWKTRC